MQNYSNKNLAKNTEFNLLFQVIYVARNVKDACVSWYYHQTLRGFKGSFTDMAKLFMEGKQLHCPTLPHIVEAWKLSRDNENLFFTTYEDMKKDLPSVVKGMALRLFLTLSQIIPPCLHSGLNSEKIAIFRQSCIS